jgi:hypothetical protein
LRLGETPALDDEQAPGESISPLSLRVIPSVSAITAILAADQERKRG